MTLNLRRTLLFFSVTFLCIWHSWALPSLSQDIDLYVDVQQRLNALKTYIFGNRYHWDITWISERNHSSGSLMGQTIEHFHWMELTFENGHMLCFDKINPTVALYPNRLSLYPLERWLDPLPDNPALCCYMLAMPFLKGTILSCEKTAKKGRKAIKVLLQQDLCEIELYLDKHFNTILSAELTHRARAITGSFTLKNLKKFKQGWSLYKAEYVLNGLKTTLVVNRMDDLH